MNINSSVIAPQMKTADQSVIMQLLDKKNLSGYLLSFLDNEGLKNFLDATNHKLKLQKFAYCSQQLKDSIESCYDFFCKKYCDVKETDYFGKESPIQMPMNAIMSKKEKTEI